MADRCRITSTARFESYRLMKRCHNASTLCIAMLSLEIIVINLLVFIPTLELGQEVITITTVCLSAFVLVLSLIISQLHYEKKAHEYHVCGIELANLEKEIQIYISCEKPETYEIMMDYNKRYNQIIKKCPFNHNSTCYKRALYNIICKNEPIPISVKSEKLLSKLENFITFIKWHFLMADSIYNLLTFLGAAAIVATIMYGKNTLSVTEILLEPNIHKETMYWDKNVPLPFED